MGQIRWSAVDGALAVRLSACLILTLIPSSLADLPLDRPRTRNTRSCEVGSFVRFDVPAPIALAPEEDPGRVRSRETRRCLENSSAA